MNYIYSVSGGYTNGPDYIVSGPIGAATTTGILVDGRNACIKRPGWYHMRGRCPGDDCPFQ